MAPASNVQVMPEPDPKVLVPISVVSKLRVYVSPESAVSIPLVPPLITKVSPFIIEPEPVSPPVLKLDIVPPPYEQVIN